jgi:hypothetical protein
MGQTKGDADQPKAWIIGSEYFTDEGGTRESKD